MRSFPTTTGTESGGEFFLQGVPYVSNAFSNLQVSVNPPPEDQNFVSAPDQGQKLRGGAGKLPSQKQGLGASATALNENSSGERHDTKLNNDMIKALGDEIEPLNFDDGEDVFFPSEISDGTQTPSSIDEIRTNIHRNETIPEDNLRSLTSPLFESLTNAVKLVWWTEWVQREIAGGNTERCTDVIETRVRKLASNCGHSMEKYGTALRGILGKSSDVDPKLFGKGSFSPESVRPLTDITTASSTEEALAIAVAWKQLEIHGAYLLRIASESSAIGPSNLMTVACAVRDDIDSILKKLKLDLVNSADANSILRALHAGLSDTGDSTITEYSNDELP